MLHLQASAVLMVTQRRQQVLRAREEEVARGQGAVEAIKSRDHIEGDFSWRGCSHSRCQAITRSFK
jgi:hypothetical protein